MKHLCKLLFWSILKSNVVPGPEESGHPWILKSITLQSFRVANRIWALEFAFWFYHLTNCMAFGKVFSLFAPQFLLGVMMLHTILEMINTVF